MHLIFIVCVSVIFVLDLILAAPSIFTADKMKDAVETLDKEVFKLPRKLKVGDKIHVSGLMMTKKESLTINLVKGDSNEPDYTNVACQLKLDFPGDVSNTDRITINTIVDGKRTERDEGAQSTHMFSDNTFTINFHMRDDNKVELDINDSSTEKDCKLEYGIDAISYLTLGGDVHKVHKLNFLLV